MIWAVVLAAGESKRMGEPKLLLPFGLSTVIETVLERIAASAVDKTLVVLGAARERIEDRVKKFPVRTTLNPHFRLGMLSSVQWGIRALPQDAQAALIFLGDQPWISPRTIDLLLKNYRATGKGLVLPVYRNSGGHPLLIDLKYREEIQKISPAVGLTDLLSLHPEDIFRVEIKDPAILKDMDTPQDYRRESRRKSLPRRKSSP
jgi:molybdenum cofactor cytidylyltransferase